MTPTQQVQSQPLAGQTAVITGAASGIGAATAGLLAQRGAYVVIGDIVDEAQDVADKLCGDGLNARFIKTDVTDEDSVANLIDTAQALAGRLDIVVANAGIAEPKGPLHELDLAAWNRVLGIDLTGLMLTDKHALRHMSAQGSGSIVNLSSIIGAVGQPNSAAYSAAKAAVANLTRSTAVTYAAQGIRVNAVAPGYVDTPLVASLPGDVRDGMIAKEPIGRLARPEEIANVIAFLAGPESTFVVGALIAADGGYTAV